MSKANVDPTELRRFASDLNRFNAELGGLLQGLNGRLRQLESSWQDQEQRKFTEEFEQTAKAMARFLEAAHTHAKFLNKKAEHIEAYLGR